MIGKTISHYRITGKLGQGGMGVVYKALDTALDRSVALKLLPADLAGDPQAKKRFIQEARAVSALDHPNICTLYEIGETDDRQIFFAMACYTGETAAEKITRGPLRIEDAVEIALQTAQGLAKAHEHGIVHRDIKPANIMLTEGGVVKILDFGLAKLSGESTLTRTGATLGTVPYMSPEQAKGETVDHRTDIWSLGATMYEMLTGRLPFVADHGPAMAYQIVNVDPEPITGLRTGVPLELERIVSKCLEKKAEERYQTAADLIADIRRLQRTAGEPTRGRTTRAPSRKRRYAWATAALLIGLTAVFFLTRPLLFEKAVESAPTPIAVIPFVNQTGDDSYDYLQDAIPNLLITSLEQSKYLRVMTWERMHDLLAQIGKGHVDKIDKELGFELCRREGVQAIVIGSFVKAGDTFATDAKVLDVNTKELLKTARARGEGVQSILDSQIDELSKDIARGVGLSERKVATVPVQIASVTTNSMEAYNYFLRGRDDFEEGNWLQVVPSLEQAVRLDSTFAMAYLYLGRAYGTRGNVNQRDANYRKAKEHAAQASEKERLYIEAVYAGAIEKEPLKRIEILKTIADRFPGEKQVYVDLGQHYLSQGLHEETIGACNKALALDPEYGSALKLIAYAYAGKDDYDRAIEYLDEYASSSPGEHGPMDAIGDMYFYKGDMRAAMAKYKEAIAATPESFTQFKVAYIHALLEDYPAALATLESFLEHVPPSVPLGGVRAVRSLYHYLTGERDRAFRDLDESRRIFSTLGNLYYAASMDRAGAWFLLTGGDPDSVLVLADESARVMIEQHPTGRTEVLFVLALLRGFAALESGRTEEAAKQVAAAEGLLDGVSPPIEKESRYSLALFKAAASLAQGNADGAIAEARRAFAARPSSLDVPTVAAYNIISVYPPLRDVVARAYVKKGRLAEAISEYERLTTFDPTREDRRLISPQFHYSLARLYEESGADEKAISQYERFLRIWAGADPGLPELIDAKARLERLRRSSR